MSSDYPIGAILPYAGEDLQAIGTCGWILCNGGSYVSTSPLADVIGEIYGTYQLPDFQGQFLRGSDGGVDDDGPARGMDPDAGSRTSPNPADSPGGSIGSTQSHQIRLHSHSYPQLNSLNLQEDTYEKPCQHVLGSLASGLAGGSEKETRPVNMYTYFMINGSNSETPDTPIGTVLFYPGPVSAAQGVWSSGWLYCGDASYSIEESSPYYNLSTVLNNAYGNDGTGNTFAIPDYRGVFLRGVNGSESVHPDPDVGSRTMANPNLANGGNQGNSVGSWQDSAFIGHTHSYSTTTGTKGMMSETDRSVFTDDLVSSLPSAGTAGGNETRPVNMYVNHLICYANADSPGVTFQVPIGAMVAYAGPLGTEVQNQLKSQGWLYCNGQVLDIETDPQYQDLYNVIGFGYGGDNVNQFCVPDCRGIFLRGQNNGRTLPNQQLVDPDQNNRTGSCSNSKMPNQGNTDDNVGSLQPDQFASHTHTYNQYDTRDGDDSPGSTPPYYMASDQLTNFDDYGGSETRPQNVYVYYLIKFQ